MPGMKLREADWYALVESPAVGERMGASPIFLKEVRPLKTGKSLLHLDFLQPIHPRSGIRRQFTLQILERGFNRITGVVDDHPRRQSCILSPLDEPWLNDWCGDLRARRPTWSMALLMDGQQFGGADLDEVMRQLFGEREEEILNGALPSSFGGEQTRAPSRTETVPFSLTLPPFESWLAARGFVPQAMEQKWFIHRNGDDRMHFRRSWTGNLVYDVAISWTGQQITFGDFEASREPGYYDSTDPDYDVAVLSFLIRGILLGLPVSFPSDPNEPEDLVHAWAAAGSQAGAGM